MPTSSIAGDGPAGLAILAGLGAAATWAFGSHLFSRQLAAHRQLTAAGANLFKNGGTALLYGLLMGLLGWSLPAGEAWPWLLGSGFLGFAVGDALYFAAFPRCGVQLAALCANLIPPLAALLGFLVRGTRLAPLGLAGMALTLLGIAWVVSDQRSRGAAFAVTDRRQRWVGLGFAATAALAQAGAIVLGARGFENIQMAPSGLIPGTVLRLLGGALGALLMGFVIQWFGPRGQPSGLGGLLRPLRVRALALALVVPSAVAAWINLPMHSLALAQLPEGLSAILFALTPVFTLPIGLALGARYGVRTLAGTLIAFIGVAVVILYGSPSP